MDLLTNIATGTLSLPNAGTLQIIDHTSEYCTYAKEIFGSTSEKHAYVGEAAYLAVEKVKIR